MAATQRYFGLDLSGYSRCRSGLAELTVSDGAYVATIYRDHPFAKVVGGHERLDAIVQRERHALSELTSLGTVLVDVPIDVEELFHQPAPTFVWELTARPVDFAFDALRPLADRIGAAVARFRHLSSEQSSANLLETYPAASLSLSGLRSTQYKDEPVSWEGDQWVGGPLAEVATGMRLVPTGPLEANDDEIDAILCAFAGAAPAADILSGDALADVVRKRICEKKKIRAADHPYLRGLAVPPNYQIFRSPPSREIRVVVKDWSSLGADAA